MTEITNTGITNTGITNTGAAPDRPRTSTRGWRWRGLLAVGLAAVMVTGIGVTARADDRLVLPAGFACDFELQIDVLGDGPQVSKTFTDRNGNLVTLVAGTGNALVYTNTATGTMYSTKANGAVTRTTTEADGTQTSVATGHNVLILFPSDVPAGPSTTLYVGRVVFKVAPDGTFTLQETRGTALDLCGVLSS